MMVTPMMTMIRCFYEPRTRSILFPSAQLYFFCDLAQSTISERESICWCVARFKQSRRAGLDQHGCGRSVKSVKRSGRRPSARRTSSSSSRFPHFHPAPLLGPLLIEQIEQSDRTVRPVSQTSALSATTHALSFYPPFLSAPLCSAERTPLAVRPTHRPDHELVRRQRSQQGGAHTDLSGLIHGARSTIHVSRTRGAQERKAAAPYDLVSSRYASSRSNPTLGSDQGSDRNVCAVC